MNQLLNSTIVDLEDRRVGISTVTGGFDKDELPSMFPTERWNTQLVRYIEYWRWFTGEVWNEKDETKNKKGQQVLKYPLQINLARSAAFKHNSVLFGETPDSPGPLVPCEVNPRLDPSEKAPSKQAKLRAAQVGQLVNEVWEDNDGRTIQLEGGVLSHALGGIVYRLGWEPQNPNLSHGIKIEMILPDFFLPVWNSSDLDDLLEVWVVYRVPGREAELRFGHDPAKGASPILVEHWTKFDVTITLNNTPLSMEVNGETFVFDKMVNPFGEVPFTYIPIGRSGSFYGDSIIDPIKGTSKEYNARMADLGDVIGEGAHRDIFLQNVGATRPRDIGASRDVIELTPANPQGDTPTAFSIDAANLPEALLQFPEMVRKQFIRDSSISSVAEGEDEGSQRSALTLAFRMYPLTSKARVSRTYWGAGLTRINKMIARFAALKGMGGLTPAHLERITFVNKWASMIPRDREQEVNETVLLLSGQSLTPKTALEKLEFVNDPYAEVAELKEWIKWLSDIQTQAAVKQKVQTAQQSPIADTGLNNK